MGANLTSGVANVKYVYERAKDPPELDLDSCPRPGATDAQRPHPLDRGPPIR
jgi:hypothetical protein